VDSKKSVEVMTVIDVGYNQTGSGFFIKIAARSLLSVSLSLFG
jgi:hypothetical protein